MLFAENKYQQDKKLRRNVISLYETTKCFEIEYENAQLNAKNSLSNYNALKNKLMLFLQQAKQQQINAQGQFKTTRFTLTTIKLKTERNNY